MFTLSVLVGQRIREIRESKNIKQNKLAEMINIEPTNLSKIENGAHFPKDETLQKIANALECEKSELFNFRHIQTREDLISCLNEMISKATTEEIQFFFKILTSYKELKQ